MLARESDKVSSRRINSLVLDDISLVGDRQKSHDSKAALIASAPQLQEIGGALTGAVYHDTAPKQVLVD
jgi:hypothetical protein